MLSSKDWLARVIESVLFGMILAMSSYLLGLALMGIGSMINILYFMGAMLKIYAGFIGTTAMIIHYLRH